VTGSISVPNVKKLSKIKTRVRGQRSSDEDKDASRDADEDADSEDDDWTPEQANYEGLLMRARQAQSYAVFRNGTIVTVIASVLGDKDVISRSTMRSASCGGHEPPRGVCTLRFSSSAAMPRVSSWLSRRTR
jgi:hypothetical protein